MKHYINELTGEIFAYDDDYVVLHLKPIGDNELKEILELRSTKLTYSQKRACEYPPMSDYLDGIVKNDSFQINAYIAACLAVKAKYPKV